MLRLYSTPLSANGRKVLAVRHHLGLDAEIHEVDVYRGHGRSPEYLAINPWGKIPTLVEGDLVLWESNAILQYLADAHGGGRLWGQSPERRADVSRWLFWESAHWQPAFTPLLAEVVGQLLSGVASPETSRVRWDDPQWSVLAKFLERHLDGRRFLVADELSLADFSVAAMMMYVRRAGFPNALWPAISEWYSRIEALDAWQATAAGPWREEAPAP